MTCNNGLYLSVYAHIDGLCHAYEIPVRHDQNMALWKKTDDRVVLLRYWEFERYSGQKHHKRSFASREQALVAIDALLSEAGVDRDGLQAVWGTPGLSQNASAWEGTCDFNTHTRAHLYGAMLAETEHYFEGDMIGLALDGGPDTVLGKPDHNAPIYAGAVSRQGEPRVFPVSSPGPLWSAMRELTGMEEGTLMALGSACRTEGLGLVDEAPKVFTMKDYASAYNWVRRWFDEISRYDTNHKGRYHTGFDSRFSPAENRVAMLVKIVQRISDAQLSQTLRQIIDKEGLDPATTTLAMGGGFGLNCRSNSYAMRTIGFRRFQSIPAVNDSGISLGYGMMFFLNKMKRFKFSFENVGKGAVAAVSNVSAEATPNVIVEDLAKGPIIWIEGGAEIGPRALGHRSLLADPRLSAMKDRLNQIKRRQWWRPVAPVILEDHVDAWFEEADTSPFMLRTFTLRPEVVDLVPAISHLDRSARIQTLSRSEAPALHALLQAFHASTGVPMLCNTSLNDKGEPIINTLDEAVIFAKRRGISAIYVDGRRHTIDPDEIQDSTVLVDRRLARLFQSNPDECAKIRMDFNPHDIDRNTLAMRQFLPVFEAMDITDETVAYRLRRHATRLAKDRILFWSLML